MDKIMLDQIVFITGGGTGIGKASAKLFAQAGAQVIIMGRRQERLEQAVSEITAEGGKCCYYVCDVTNTEKLNAVFEDVHKRFGKVDVLVNDAGYSKEGPFMELSQQDWEYIMKVNVYGPVNCIKAVLPGMIERGSGAIVNIASAAGERGLPNSAAYSAAKAAVIAMSQSLGEDLRLKGVRVNVMNPGPVDTEILQNSNVRDYLLSTNTDLCPPEDTAKGIFFLGSPLSGYLNAQSISWRARYRW